MTHSNGPRFRRRDHPPHLIEISPPRSRTECIPRGIGSEVHGNDVQLSSLPIASSETCSYVGRLVNTPHHAQPGMRSSASATAPSTASSTEVARARLLLRGPPSGPIIPIVAWRST